MMKKILFYLFFIITVQKVYSQNNSNIKEFIDNNSFKFHAEKIIASGNVNDFKVNNSVTYISRFIDLNQEFYISIDNNILNVDLPDYQSQVDQSQGALLNRFIFTSKDFKISKKKNKKGLWTITLKPLDVKRSRTGTINQIVINSNEVGKASAIVYLRLYGPNSTIVFDGYISDNKQ